MLTRLYLTTGISPAKVTIHLPPRKAVLVIESNEEDLVTSDDDSDIDQKQKHLTDTESEAEEMPRRIKHRKRAKQLWSISSDDAMSKLPKRRGRPRKGRISDDELPVPKKRCHGRPHKDKENQPPKGFDVSVVVEVAQPPLHVKGKTPKGHKWVKQEPI
jgi:hypothetical protein